MAINWKDYKLVLIDESKKECEVTGRDMGGIENHECPVDKMKAGEQVMWTPGYGGYQTVDCKFQGADDEGIHLIIHSGYDIQKTLKPGEEWSSGWYSFGTWDYIVKIRLEKIVKEEEKKPFFVHTMTDDDVTSDYADAKEAYGG